MKRWLAIAGVAAGLLMGLAPRSPAATKQQVELAIKRGVKWLRSRAHNGFWSFSLREAAGDVSHDYGMTALAGLTLLECDVPPSDKLVQKAAQNVRQWCVTPNAVDDTYTISLAIMFLDKLANPADEALIQGLVMRILAGQGGSGGWTYRCPALPGAVVAGLQERARQVKLKTGRPGTGGDDGGKAERADAVQIQATVNEMKKTFKPQMQGGFAKSDNSNTQFAALAIWIGRRHGVPVDEALKLILNRFENEQNGDGGWSYERLGFAPQGAGGGSTPTMTCAGLIGLAVGHGAELDGAKPPDLNKDDHVVRALKALGTTVGNAAIPVTPRAYYYFWSLERVGVIYQLDTIGGKNWYKWVSNVLVKADDGTGVWRGEYQFGADTCFALLALKKANVAKDLSTKMRGKIADPRTLKGGGVFGDEAANNKGTEPDTQPEPREGAGDATGTKPTPKPVPLDTNADPKVARLAQDLVSASGDEQSKLLKQYMKGQGAEYTQAMVAACHALAGAAQKDVRDALANRLSRKKLDNLRAYLKDSDAELRAAAVWGAFLKGQKAIVPDLIERLQDENTRVAKAALYTLKDFTKKDFGPGPGADRSEWAAAAAKWKAWWDSEGSGKN
jgi:hypothetical protein